MGLMQFTNSDSWGWAGLALAATFVLAGCTAPVPAPAPKALEVAEPAVQQPLPVAPMIGIPAEAPSVQAPAPSQATPQAVTQPIPRRRPMPRYPPSLAETGLTGTVVVSFVVGAQGRPEEVRIESSSHPMFTAEVKAVLPLWRFEPARDATGGVVRERMRVPFRFLLED
jgi:protein TonB